MLARKSTVLDSSLNLLSFVQHRTFTKRRTRLDEYDHMEIKASKPPRGFMRTSIELQQPKDLAETIHSAGRLDIHQEPFWDKAAILVTDMASAFRPKEITLIINAFSKAGRSDSTVFNELAKQIALKCSEFRPIDLAVVLNAYGRVRFKHDQLMNILASEAPRKFPDMGLRGVCLVALSFARVGFAHQRLFDCIAREVVSKIKHCTDQDLHHVCSAFRVVNLRNTGLLEAVSGELKKRIPNMDIQYLTSLLRFFAKLKYCNTSIVAGGASRLLEVAHKIPLGDIPSILCTMSTFPVNTVPLFRRLLSTVARNPSSYKAEDIAWVLQSLWASGFSDDSFFTFVKSTSSKMLNSYNIEDRVSLLERDCAKNERSFLTFTTLNSFFNRGENALESDHLMSNEQFIRCLKALAISKNHDGVFRCLTALRFDDDSDPWNIDAHRQGRHNLDALSKLKLHQIVMKLFPTIDDWSRALSQWKNLNEDGANSFLEKENLNEVTKIEERPQRDLSNIKNDTSMEFVEDSHSAKLITSRPDTRARRSHIGHRAKDGITLTVRDVLAELSQPKVRPGRSDQGVQWTSSDHSIRTASSAAQASSLNDQVLFDSYIQKERTTNDRDLDVDELTASQKRRGLQLNEEKKSKTVLVHDDCEVFGERTESSESSNKIGLSQSMLSRAETHEYQTADDKDFSNLENRGVQLNELTDRTWIVLSKLFPVGGRGVPFNSIVEAVLSEKQANLWLRCCDWLSVLKGRLNECPKSVLPQLLRILASSYKLADEIQIEENVGELWNDLYKECELLLNEIIDSKGSTFLCGDVDALSAIAKALTARYKYIQWRENAKTYDPEPDSNEQLLMESNSRSKSIRLLRAVEKSLLTNCKVNEHSKCKPIIRLIQAFDALSSQPSLDLCLIVCEASGSLNPNEFVIALELVTPHILDLTNMANNKIKYQEKLIGLLTKPVGAKRCQLESLDKLQRLEHVCVALGVPFRDTVDVMADQQSGMIECARQYTPEGPILMPAKPVLQEENPSQSCVDDDDSGAIETVSDRKYLAQKKEERKNKKLMHEKLSTDL
eukprot:GHVL01009079.1.p1 GENE.GHVL01009079.1~~GHVL01009079.1.p1  ORF type:complete len:1062 (+),score=164.85 GHVL01009079.1:27-3212(+)